MQEALPLGPQQPQEAPKKIPRAYQRQAINDLYRLLKLKPRGLLVAPTGAGKTVMMNMALFDAYAMGNRILFVVDADNLIDQSVAEIRETLGHVRLGFIKGGREFEEDRGARIQVASRQTMEKRDWWKNWIAEKPTVIFIDEAHVVAFAEVIRRWIVDPAAPGSPDRLRVFIIEATATPWRLSAREGMADVADFVVIVKTPGELMDDGYLLRPIYRRMASVDVSRIGQARGEFITREASVVCDNIEAISAFHERWVSIGCPAGIGFPVDKKHAHHTAAYWTRQGHPAEAITDQTPTSERRRIYERFRRRDIYAMFSCGVLTKGFDETSVEAVFLLAPTQSKAKHDQQIGRAARTHRPCCFCSLDRDGKPVQVPVDQEDPSAPICRKCLRVQPPEVVAAWQKNFWVLDQADNVRRLGMPDLRQRSEYELTRGRDIGPGAPPMKECPDCGRMILASLVECKRESGGCGHVWKRQERPVAAGELQVITRDDVARAAFHRMAKRAYQRGWSPNKAAVDYRIKFGEKPDPEWIFGSVFPSATRRNMELYASYLKRVAAKKLETCQKKGKDFDPYAWMREHFYEQFRVNIRWPRKAEEAGVDAAGAVG